MEEVEVKFLNIDISDIEQKLVSIGAERLGETISKIACFDYPDYRLASTQAWIRLRTEFGKTELTYKQRLGVTSQDGSSSDSGMKEISIVVSDFSLTHQFLLSIGFIEKFREERKRIRWQKKDVEIDLDTWPLLQPYLELESDNWDSLKTVARELQLDWESHVKCSAMQVYALNGIDENDYSILTFDKQVKK